MNKEQYRKHLALKEYVVLKTQRESVIVDYCCALTKLTRVTQNISPMPGHGSEHDYDEKVYELAQMFLKVREIDEQIQAIRDAVDSLPFIECFVIRELYFQKRKANEIAKLLDRTPRTVFNLRNTALNKLDI